MKTYKTDLHIHSVLSPCGDLEMGPFNVIKTSINKGLEIISLTDHNITENCIAFKLASQGRIAFIPGVEVCTMEDIHILLYFSSLTDSLKFQDFIFEHLLPLKFNPEKFGYQVVVDANENVVRMEDKLLISAVQLSLEDIIKTGRKFNALIILSHIDSDSYSITSQLGFLPDNLDIDAVEIQSPKSESLISTIPYPAITSSDSHYLKYLGRRYTEFYINEPTIDEIRKALRKEGKRTYRRVFQEEEIYG